MNFKYIYLIIIAVIIILTVGYYYLSIAEQKTVKKIEITHKLMQKTSISMLELIQNIEIKESTYNNERERTKYNETLVNNIETNRTKLVLNRYEILKYKSLEENQVNLSDEANISVLMYATFAQDYKFIEDLIKKGVNVNAIGHMGSSALLISALKKDLNMTRFLIKNGANINLEGAYNPILMSARINDFKTLEFLVELGANLEARVPQDGKTAFLTALVHSDEASVRYLIDKGSNIDVKDYEEGSANLYAASSGSLAKVKLIESLNADLLATDLDKHNILMSASERGDRELINYLIREKGIDVNMADNSRQNALVNASFLFNKKTMRALIENKIDINARMFEADINVLSALSAVLPKNIKYRDKELEVAKILIDAEIDLNAQSINGKTALHYAMGKNKTELVKLLVESGANVNIRDNKNMTLLDYAKRKNNGEIIKLLEEKH